MSDVADCLSLLSLLPKFVLIFVLFCLMLVVVNEADVAGAVVSFVEVVVNDDGIVFSFVAVVVNEDGFVIIDVIDPFVVNDASVLAFVALIVVVVVIVFVVVGADVDKFVDIVVPFIVVEFDNAFIVALGSDILFNEMLNILHLKNSCLTEMFFCSLFFVDLTAES